MSGDLFTALQGSKSCLASTRVVDLDIPASGRGVARFASAKYVSSSDRQTAAKPSV